MRAVNLLPADLRSAVKAPAQVTPVVQDSGGSGAFFALGALALCVLGLAGYILTTNEIKQQQADLDQLTARSEAVTREVAALKPYADFKAEADARLTTVRDLASQRFDWETALRDMAQVMPSDVTVKKIAGSVTANSGSDSPLRGAIAAPAITVDGCTRDQESVARLMARLRTVSGVTRVSLAKSNKPQIAQTGIISDSGVPNPANAAAGCSGKGKDQAPDFQVVAFFETDAAATVAAGDPTAAAPTPEASGTAAATPTPESTPAGTADSGSSTPVSTPEGNE